MSRVLHDSYPPLAEARKLVQPQWYRCPIDARRLRHLSKRDDLQGWKQAGGHLSLYLILAATTFFFWQQASWLAFGLSLWCLGFVATFFKGTAAHELGHRTVFRTAYLNRVFLYLFCTISWWDPFDYGASHNNHHRFTTHPLADRENLLPMQPSLHPWLLFQLFTLNLLTRPGRNFGKGGFLWTVYLTTRTALGKPATHLDIPSQEWLDAIHEDQPKAFRQSILWSRYLIGFHALLFVVSMATGLWVLPLLITVPSYIAGCGSYFLGLTQHGIPSITCIPAYLVTTSRPWQKRSSMICHLHVHCGKPGLRCARFCIGKNRIRTMSSIPRYLQQCLIQLGRIRASCKSTGAGYAKFQAELL